jgi:sugar lactone lactonase YvrE
VHNHLEFSNYMAGDTTHGRLVISHPGDYYTGRQSVKVTDLEGATVLELGDTGSEPGQMTAPTGVAVDGQGRIFVADNGNHRLQAFGSNGSLLAVFGSEGAGPGQFLDMRGVGVDGQGRVFVCDPGNNRVAVLSFDGSQFSWSSAMTDVAGANGVIAGRYGRIYVSDGATNSVREYSPQLTHLRSLTEPGAPYTGPLSNPTGMAVDAQGHIIVCDTGNLRVVTMSAFDPGAVEDPEAAVLALRLLPSRPNPFEQETQIRFDLPRASVVSLRVYDASGRLVRSLIDAGTISPGRHEVAWDGRSAGGRRVATGVYFARLVCAGEVRTERIVRLR